MAMLATTNSTNNRRVLLLDFDGVVVRNVHLARYQNRRSARFVQLHTKMELNECERLNAKYYPRFGHTVTMLNEMFGKDVSLASYQEFVFCKKAMHDLDEFFYHKSRHHTREFGEVFEYCASNDIACSIFTNAHPEWVSHFTALSGLGMDDTPVVFPETLDELKPNLAAYQKAAAILGGNGGETTGSYVFVDDSTINLDVAEKEFGWKPFLFGRDHSATSIIELLRSQRTM